MSGRTLTRGIATAVAAALALGGCGSGGRASNDGGALDLSGAGGAGGTGGGDDGGCAWNNGTPSLVGGPAPAQGNSADLRGSSIGDVSFDAATMRRVVPVTVAATTIAGIQVGSAYLTRSDPSAEAAYLTIPVANTGTGHPCFLLASPLRYEDAGGALLNADTDVSYAFGSVGDAGFGIYSDSCLAPGDRGYFIDIQLSVDKTIFSSTASIEVALGASEGTTPAGRLVPTGFDLGTCAGERTLRISAVNDGTGPISVPLYSGFPDSPTILVDADGLPAGWTYLGVTEAAAVPPGATATYTGSVASRPAVPRAYVFLSFGPPATTAAAALALPGGLAAAADRLRASREALHARWRAATSARGYKQIP